MSKSGYRHHLWAATAGLLALSICAGPAFAQFTTVFTDPHPLLSGGTIGFAYAGDMFVGSVYHGGTDALYKTDLTGGSVAQFAPTVSIPGGVEEHFVSSSLGLGGFPSRDIYVGVGNTILHINHAGTSSDTLVSGFSGTVRGIVFDDIGTFSNHMLVTTTSGDIYEVTSTGAKTVIASSGQDTEGLDVAPFGSTFGPPGLYDGDLIVDSEGSNTVRAVNHITHAITTIVSDSVLGGAEELSIVPLDLGLNGDPVEGFYGANFTENVIKAGVGVFAGMQGDLVITGENSHHVHQIHWNGTSEVITDIGTFPDQPEDGIFVTTAIIRATVPEPGSMAMLLGLAVSGTVVMWRRRK